MNECSGMNFTMINPIHVTLEPNEANTDGSSMTLYFAYDNVTIVKQWVEDNPNPYYLPLRVDITDPYFEVHRTDKQPFECFGIFRFQANPGG